MNRPDVIDRLRDAFPSIRGFGFALIRADLRMRRVCDGMAVLDAAVNRPAELTQLGVRPAQLTALTALATAVDALADLHVAEAALGVVKGPLGRRLGGDSRGGRPGAAPDFDVVRTPRAGRVVNTVAVVVLPNANAPTGTRPSPAALADPAVARYLDDRAGDPAGPAWTWTSLDAAGAQIGTVTLAAIGLRPCDTVGLGAGNLRDVVRDVSGAAGLGPADPPGHAVVRALAAALAGFPALAEDVGGAVDPRAPSSPSWRSATRRCATRRLPRPPTRARRPPPPPPRPRGERRSDGSHGGESRPSPPTPTTRPSEAWPTASAARPRCSSAGSPSRREPERTRR